MRDGFFFFISLLECLETGCKIWTHLQRIVTCFGILAVNSNKGADAEDWPSFIKEINNKFIDA